MQQLLESINQFGITSSQACSIRGALKDASNANMYYYNQIDLSSLHTDQYTQAFTSLVFHEKEGAWTIAMERHFSRGDALELSTAIMNSIVFIFELDSLAVNGETTYCLPTHDNRLCKKESQDNRKIFFAEIRQKTTNSAKGIAREKFRAILVPYHLTDLVKSVFKNICIIPCNVIKEELQEDPLELFVTKKTAIGKKIVGPNYLRGLELFHQSFPNINKFGIHLTRLPMTPINYLDHQLIVTEYNQAYWRAARLTNIKPQQLNFLRSYSDILVFPETVHTLFVIFRPPMRAKIELIVNHFDKLSQASTIIQRNFRGRLDRQALTFFRDRRQKIEAAKKEMIEHVKGNRFQQCAELAIMASKLEDDALVDKRAFQEKSACQFLTRKER